MKGLYLVGLLVLASFGSVHAITLSDFLTGVNPDSPVYKIKIIVEEIDLKLPGDEIAKREVFAQRRLEESQIMVRKGDIERARVLVKESEDHIMKIKIKIDTRRFTSQEEKFEKLQKISAVDEKYRNSIFILEQLLADSNIPNASRQGLQTALEAVRKRADNEIDEVEDEIKEMEDEVDDDVKKEFEKIKIEVRRKSGLVADEVDLTDCSGVRSAQLITQWRMPRHPNPNIQSIDVIAQAKNSCEARKLADAGWELVNEVEKLTPTGSIDLTRIDHFIIRARGEVGEQCFDKEIGEGRFISSCSRRWIQNHNVSVVQMQNDLIRITGMNINIEHYVGETVSSTEGVATLPKNTPQNVLDEISKLPWVAQVSAVPVSGPNIPLIDKPLSIIGSLFD